MLLVSLWLVFILAFCAYFSCTAAGRASIGFAIRYVRARRFFCGAVALSLLALVIGFSFLVFGLKSGERRTLADSMFLETYASFEVFSGAFSDRLTLADSMEFIPPELASIVPTALFALEEIAGRPISAKLSKTGPSKISLEILLNTSFKNRGIRTRKLLQKRLGRDYEVTFSEAKKIPTLSIAYNGKDWDSERLLALPASVSARRFGVEPENLMALLTVAPELYPGLSPAVLDSAASLLGPGAMTEQMFEAAFKKMPYVADSMEAKVYARSALRYAEYFRKFGLPSL